MTQLIALDRTDFAGGINAVASPWKVGPNEVLRAMNVILDEDGALTVRDGAKTIDTAPPQSARILTLGMLTKVDGTRIPLAVVRMENGTQQLYRRDTQPWTALGSFAGSYDTPQIIPWLNQAIIVSGYEVPWVTDGVTMTQISGAQMLPGARWMAIHRNALWAWNTAPTTSLYDGPSSLRQSDVQNYTSWPPSHQLFLAQDDGSVGTGLAVFTVAEAGITPTDFLVAFKTFSTYQVNGAFGGGNSASFVRVKTNMGCVAGRSIEFVTGNGFQGLLRLTHRGFALFAGLADVLVSEKIRPYLFGHGDIQGLNWPQIERSVAAQVQNPPLYLCACPVIGEERLTRVFVFDLQRRAWTICEFPVPFATLDQVLDAYEQPLVVAGEWGGRRVQRLFAGDGDDDGMPQPWSVRMPPVGPPFRPMYVHRLLLKLFHVAAQQAITGTFVLGPQTLRITRSGHVQAQTAAEAPSGAPLAAFAEEDVVFPIGLTGEVLYSEYSGTGMLSIRGISQHVRAKPLREMVRV